MGDCRGDYTGSPSQPLGDISHWRPHSFPSPAVYPEQLPWRPYERQMERARRKGGTDGEVRKWGGRQEDNGAGRIREAGDREDARDFLGPSHFWTPPPTQGSSLPPYQLLALPPRADFSTFPSLPSSQDSASQGFSPELSSVLRREIFHSEQMASFGEKVKPSCRHPRFPADPTNRWSIPELSSPTL